jgi:hypothetical protein
VRKATKILLAATVTAGGVLAAAAPASAYVDGDYAASGVRIRTSAPSGTILGLGYPGQGARLWCWVVSTTINGNPFWDNNTDRSTGVHGYSAEGLLTPQYANIPQC